MTIPTYNYSQSTVCFTKQFFSHQIWTWSMINLPLVVSPLCGLVHLWVAKGIAETAEFNTELCAGSGEVRWGSAGSCSKVRVPTGYENKLGENLNAVTCWKHSQAMRENDLKNIGQLGSSSNLSASSRSAVSSPCVWGGWETYALNWKTMSCIQVQCIKMMPLRK